MFLFLFLFFSMLLQICSFFQIERIISSDEKWFNYIVTFFFWKMPKNWVGQTTLKGEKKEDGLKDKKYYFRETCWKKT